MEDKAKIVARLEEAYKETRLGITSLVYYKTPEGVEYGKEIYGEYVDVFIEDKSSPWITVDVYADSGAALIYDVAKAIFRRI